MMKKLLILMLVLGLVSAASATVVTYTPSIGGSTADYSATAFEVVYVDIDAAGTDQLMSTGELLITITGDAEITDIGSLTYAPSQAMWDPGMVLIVNSALDDALNARVFAGTVATNTMFYLTLPDSPVGNIGITYGSGTVTVTIVPNNAANAWGNTVYYTGGTAYDDLDAAGGAINIIPEPMTIALLGLGGLFLLRRRRK